MSQAKITYEAVLESLRAADQEIEKEKQELAKSLADALDHLSSDGSAEKIRKQGLPKKILAGANVYPYVPDMPHVVVERLPSFWHNKDYVTLTW